MSMLYCSLAEVTVDSRHGIWQTSCGTCLLLFSFHALSDGSGLAQVAEHSSLDMYSSTISNPSVEAPPLLLGFGLTAPWYSCHRRCTSSTYLLHNRCWSPCMSVCLISVLTSTKNWRTTVLHNVLLSFLHATQIF